VWDKEIGKESSIPAVPIASFRLWARIYRAQGRSKIAVGEGRPTPAELKKKRRKAARQLLRRDASPSAPLVLAQAAETKVVVAAVEENRELWKSVLIAFLREVCAPAATHVGTRPHSQGIWVPAVGLPMEPE